MPFTFTAAHSSRITKSKPKKPSFSRDAHGSFPGSSRRKAKLAKQVAEDSDDDFDERLEDKGLIKTLATDLSLRDVVPTLKHIRSTIFDDVPTERSGMNSTRTAEVLNFRRSFPPLVTNAHVHALVNSPSSVEKEIAKLATAGLVRRVTVPGRGTGASSISDCLVLVQDWIDLIKGLSLETAVEEKYINMLTNGDRDTTSLQQALSGEELTELMRAGLLTASTSEIKVSSNVLSSSRNNLSSTLTSIHSISRAASGSFDAIGGQGAVLASGGGGASGLKSASTSNKVNNLSATLPNTGAFLKLVEDARTHLVNLLMKSKYNEAPLYLLKERWDGNINTKTPYGRSKDPFSIVLPGKTRKWKEFNGLKFDWVLAECLGGGMVEVFDTGSVGLGVRVA